jgi:hypothetical protein
MAEAIDGTTKRHGRRRPENRTVVPVAAGIGRQTVVERLERDQVGPGRSIGRPHRGGNRGALRATSQGKK